MTVRDISIRFGEQRVLKRVSMDLFGGRVHALVGENGSGKSTLVKILASYYQADHGSLRLDDVELLEGRFDASMARNAGIRFVHQDLKLVGSMNAVENVALTSGYVLGRGSRIHWSETRSMIVEWLADRFGRSVDATVPVSRLSAIDRVHVAIARALFTLPGVTLPRVLVLDEVTSGLPRTEIDGVARLIAGVREAGVAILFISHDLDEVMRLADEITVLREGAVIGSRDSAHARQEEITTMILGRPAGDLSIRKAEKPPTGRPVLALRGVSTETLDRIDFELRPGEAIGITGGVGSGKSAMGRLLYGAQPPLSGEVLVDDKPIRNLSPTRAIARGIGYVPQHHAALSSLTVRENIGIVSLEERTRFGWLSMRRDRAIARERLVAADVRPPEPERLIDVLSGGNRQKVVLAKWTSRRMRALIVDEVTANVDVGATEAIHKLLRERVEQGLGLVVISSDYRELERLCDSVLILDRGRVGEVLQGSSVDQHRIAERILAGFSPGESEAFA